jgi:hypothetical protein
VDIDMIHCAATARALLALIMLMELSRASEYVRLDYPSVLWCKYEVCSAAR